MRTLILTMALAGCAEMTDAGSMFEPVPVDTPAPAAPDATTSGVEFADPDGFVLSSEQMHEEAEAAKKAKAAGNAPPAPETDVADAAPVEPEAAPDPAPDTEANDVATTAQLTPTATTSLSHSSSSGWPVRLVSTLPNAQPPRAILGMPDGQELVVKPGTMLPDAGLIVMAVGTNQVQLAKVQAVGDHATVSSVELTAQF